MFGHQDQLFIIIIKQAIVYFSGKFVVKPSFGMTFMNITPIYTFHVIEM